MSITEKLNTAASQSQAAKAILMRSVNRRNVPKDISQATTQTDFLIKQQNDYNTYKTSLQQKYPNMVPHAEYMYLQKFRTQQNLELRDFNDGIIEQRKKLVEDNLTALANNSTSNVYTQRYITDFIGIQISGAGNRELANTMTELQNHILQNNDPKDAKQLIETIADIRGVDGNTLFDQYEQMRQTMYDQNINFLPLNSDRHDDFMGSNSQLRYGKVVGDSIGIDPVIASLMNPSGGLVGGGNSSVNADPESPIHYHGVFHDAAGFMGANLGLKPGYSYVEDIRIEPGVDIKPYQKENPLYGLFGDGTDTNPLSGQGDGIPYFENLMNTSYFTRFDHTFSTVIDVGVIDTWDKQFNPNINDGTQLIAPSVLPGGELQYPNNPPSGISYPNTPPPSVLSPIPPSNPFSPIDISGGQSFPNEPFLEPNTNGGQSFPNEPFLEPNTNGGQSFPDDNIGQTSPSDPSSEINPTETPMAEPNFPNTPPPGVASSGNTNPDLDLPDLGGPIGSNIDDLGKDN